MYLKDEPHFLYVEVVDTEWKWFRIHYTAEYVQYSEKDADGHVCHYIYDPDTGEIAAEEMNMETAREKELWEYTENTPIIDTNKVEGGNFPLSQTYTNVSEGISFMYPEGWTVGEESPDLLIRVTAPNESELAGAEFRVSKDTAHESFFTLNESDWEESFQKIEKRNDAIENISLLSLDDISLSGYPAKKMVVRMRIADGGSFKAAINFYLVDLKTYATVCISHEELWDQCEPVFEEIMDSYVITDVFSGREADTSDSGLVEEVPFGYEGEDSYTDYIEWGGVYEDGWMDTTLTFSLYSDGGQYPECGYMTTNFRGMENTGELYYLGDSQFRWDSEGYDSSIAETYYVYPIYNDGRYQLDLYNSNGEYEVTFTLYEQYIS